MKTHKLKLQPGAREFAEKAPVLEFIPNGRLTYLWVGFDARGDMRCIGTASGRAMDRFVEAWLKARRSNKESKR